MFHTVNKHDNYTEFHPNPRDGGSKIAIEREYIQLSWCVVVGMGMKNAGGVDPVFITKPLVTEIEDQTYTLVCGKCVKTMPLKTGNVIKISTFEAFFI